MPELSPKPIVPVDSSGNPIPSTGTLGRTGGVAAPCFRGALAPEVFFIENGATVTLAESVVPDEYRAYFVVVKDDTENTVWAGTLVIDAGTLVSYPAAAAPAVIQTDTADRVRIWYDASTTSYLIENQLTDNDAYVSLIRIG